MRFKTRRTIRSIRSRKRVGTELLELGLVLGLILLPIMFGTVEFGTYYFVEHNLQAIAREGARQACVLKEAEWDGAVEDAKTRIMESSSLSQFDGLNVEVGWDKVVESDTKVYVRVTASTTWDQVPTGLRPMLMIKNAESHELKGVATMFWEANDKLDGGDKAP